MPPVAGSFAAVGGRWPVEQAVVSEVYIVEPSRPLIPTGAKDLVRAHERHYASRPRMTNTRTGANGAAAGGVCCSALTKQEEVADVISAEHVPCGVGGGIGRPGALLAKLPRASRRGMVAEGGLGRGIGRLVFDAPPPRPGLSGDIRQSLGSAAHITW